ncbi:MAG: hypothetical protein SNF33_07255 [Candidatus Algichlamydia australiensis]|nr:hypothetical protein [Chlamydiales bacterium]
MLHNVGVRIVNLPEGITVEGMNTGGVLSRRLDLNITGNRILLDKISEQDLEILIDGHGHTSEWIEKINKKNVVATDPNSNLTGIKRVNPVTLALKPKRLIREKIPVVITEPKGDSPKGYQFVDVWPYRAHVMLRGPEDIISRYKSRGVKLTFNLGDITHGELDELKVSEHNGQTDVISFDIPQHWKQIYLPDVSAAPIDIADKKNEALHIDFIRTELLPVKAPIQINLYYPLRSARTLKKGKLQLATSPLVKEVNGVKLIKEDLYTKGVSELFLQTVQNHLEITVIVGPGHHNSFDWSVQFINPRELENRYITLAMGNSMQDKGGFANPKMREEYLRNRFRSYMNRFQLYRADSSKFELDIYQHEKMITINEAHEDLCCTD